MAITTLPIPCLTSSVDFSPETVKRAASARKPLIEFSGACASCGETPYIKVVTQLFGDRMIIANATGQFTVHLGRQCTRVCPYTTNHEGRGSAWAQLPL